jgi:hypothetical protein
VPHEHLVQSYPSLNKYTVVSIPSPKMREGDPLSCRVVLSKTTTHTRQRSAPMVDMVALLQCARPPVPATTLRQLSRIIVALVVMTGRVTMLGLARWAGKGGSYRTIQRFFATVIPWATLCWVFLRQHVYRPEDVYLVGGDAVVVTKAGTPPPWPGSVLCQAVRQARARPGLFRPVPRACPATAFLIRCASSRGCAATRRRPLARLKRLPSS